ncbi:hypothetical protein OUZ56_032682 [Daphnia magna]|uniref:MULE transposase domain-containing protein n=1 Tax=Daphnia magna TaxID=35525 RepID=A0ABQ9ZWT2_9CRUS|nr:hypothetical protein OUZ56_032682 [Daphnia magna]
MVPLCLVLMSSRTQKDYIRLLKHIKTVILGNSYAMKECVVDFEKSVWLAIEKEFGIGVKIFGCGFHWTQKMMSLHLLPHGKIPTAFANLRSAVWEIENRENRTMMRKLYNYMTNTWIDSLLWPPKVWSVFMQEVRTTNDVEGWHTHLANHAGLCEILKLYWMA